MDTNTLISVIVLAVIAAVPGSIAAWQSRKNNTQNKEIIKTADATAVQVKEVKKLAVDTHAATNSHLTEVTEKWEDALALIKEQAETIRTLIAHDKAGVAQRTATAEQTGVLIEKVTESGEMNGNIVEFFKQFSELAKEMQETHATVKTLLEEQNARLQVGKK